MVEEQSREFKERTQLIKLQREADREKLKGMRELEELKFNRKMEILRTERENTRLFHENELERGRIKRAEERKLMHERSQYRGR